MKSLIFKITFPLLTAAFLLAGCQDDKAREKATEQALEKPSTPAATAPASPSTPATVGSLPLSISNKTASKGSEACVTVTARNFNQIVSMQYTMKWDKDVLKFKGLQGFNLPGLGADNFGKNHTDQGLLTYSWYDANVRGITRPDNANLYDVCFEVIGGPGSKSFVEFANAPTIIEIANVNSEFLDLDGKAGIVEVK
ncbi:MAG: hypothetical protein H6577_15015 [Lewinellaceae bacterium]|nr:hypothetical protein [Saprospiraceae bacterium]MCB9339438.1 hypothetical protein [Lewinellaceae bacterium]